MTGTSKPQNFDKLAFECGKQIHSHTIQFLVKGGKSGYKPHGSGVLLFIDNKCLIATAAHVTSDIDNNPLYVNSIKGIIQVAGYIRETDMDKDKDTDLAYISLHDQVAAILVQSYQFVPLNKIIHSHKALRSNQYLVVGYPEVNIHVDAEQRKIISGTSIFLLTMSTEKVYEYHKLDEERHYVLDFAGKGIDLETDEKSGKIADPYGMSGCGLWLLTEKPGTDQLELQYHLIGIMTMFRKMKYHCLVGNRIEILINALIEHDGFNIVY